MEKLAEDSGSRRSIFMVRQFIVAMIIGGGGGKGVYGERRAGGWSGGGRSEVVAEKELAAVEMPRLGCQQRRQTLFPTNLLHKRVNLIMLGHDLPVHIHQLPMHRCLHTHQQRLSSSQRRR